MFCTCCLSVNIDFIPNYSNIRCRIEEAARMPNTSFAQWKVTHAASWGNQSLPAAGQAGPLPALNITS